MNFHKSRYNRRPEIFVRSSLALRPRIRGHAEGKNDEISVLEKSIHYHTYRIFLFSLQFRRRFFFFFCYTHTNMIFVIFCYLLAKSVRRGGCSISHKTFLILQIEECKINYTQNPYIYVYINRVYVRGFKRNARPWSVYHVFGKEKKRPFHGISNDQI